MGPISGKGYKMSPSDREREQGEACSEIKGVGREREAKAGDREKRQREEGGEGEGGEGEAPA